MPIDGVAKKMMEKWGWSKGEGLGKHKTGIKTALLLRKQDGSATQGRIEMAKPEVDEKADKAAAGVPGVAPAVAAAPAAGAEAGQVGREAAARMEAALRGAVTHASANILASIAGGAAIAPKEEDTGASTKRRRTKWEGDDLGVVEVDAATPLAPADPAAAGAAAGAAVLAAAAAQGIQPLPAGMYDIDPRDAEAAMQAKANAELQAQLALQVQLAEQQAALASGALEAAKEPPYDGVNLRTPKPRVRIRQYVRDDWRWSQGKDALRYFEEVTLAKSLLDLARKILGPESRYPARITDDTDCVTEVTAWGTLLVRPRGTGANVALAKRMLYEVLHPSGESLREDALITPDEMAEAAVRDLTTIAQGEEEDIGEKMKTGVRRNAHGELRRVGLGAEVEAMEEATKTEAARPEAKELELSTAEDARLVQRHMDDIRIASGAIPMLVSMKLKLLGKEKNVRKAMNLVKMLVETGEWVGLTEGFIMSEETREKRKASEGPAEQILIKIADGPVVQKIEKHLKDIEYAAFAEALKLTSKAVNGKRTLMVDGTKAAHERVKLMVKELAERGDSPMLTKSMAAARSGASAPDDKAPLPKVEPKVEPPAEKVSKQVAPGVVAAPPVLTSSSSSSTAPAPVEVKTEPEDEAPAAKAPKGLGPGPAMRHLPAPKLVIDIIKGEDLFAGLPSPDAPVGGGDGGSVGSGAAGPVKEAADEAAPAFPPQPPGLAAPVPVVLDDPDPAAVDAAAAEAAAAAAVATAAAAAAAGGGGPGAAEAAGQDAPGITE